MQIHATSPKVMKPHLFFMEVKSCFVDHLFLVGALPAWEGVVQALLR